jgi:hypothetical protein
VALLVASAIWLAVRWDALSKVTKGNSMNEVDSTGQSLEKQELPNARQWPAALPLTSGLSVLGRLSRVGGTLVVTDDMVVFKPLAHLGRTRSFRLSDIEDVTTYASKPPRLRLTPYQRSPLTLAVSSYRMSSIETIDTSARDDAVTLIKARLEEQKKR